MHDIKSAVWQNIDIFGLFPSVIMRDSTNIYIYAHGHVYMHTDDFDQQYITNFAIWKWCLGIV